MTEVTQVDNNKHQFVASIAECIKEYPGTARRQEALEYLKEQGLPDSKHEEYRHTPLTRSLEKHFDIAGPLDNATQFNGNVDAYALEDLEAYTIIFINGVLQKGSNFPSIPGVTISTLEEALANTPELVDNYLGKYSSPTQDGFSAWNMAAWKSGLFLHIADKVVVDKPFVVHYVIDNLQSSGMTFSRNLMISEKNSDATVLFKFDSTGEEKHFVNIVTESIVQENAGLNLYTLQDDQGSSFQFNQTAIHQSQSSRVNSFTFTLGGQLVRNNLQFTLDGEGCDTNMYGLYLLAGNSFADNHTVVDHKKTNSYSNELYKGVINDQSKAVFNGKIYVRPHAQKTNAFQSNRNILLSDGATIHTKPQLEIWADDVKCSHGCTSGQLDEEALFYMRARGIDKESARAMLLYAFAGEVLDKVKLPQVKAYLESAITARLYKNI